MGKRGVGQGESWTVSLLESEAVVQWGRGTVGQIKYGTVGQLDSGTVCQWEKGQWDRGNAGQ